MTGRLLCLSCGYYEATVGAQCEICANEPAVKRGRGRPSEGERVDIRIPTDLLERIDRDARQADVSRAEQIRRILTLHYNPKEP